jgi:hypothetical protein
MKNMDSFTGVALERNIICPIVLFANYLIDIKMMQAGCFDMLTGGPWKT